MHLYARPNLLRPLLRPPLRPRALRPLHLAALSLCLLAAPVAQAASVPFTGTLTLEIGTLAPVEIQGSGVATVNGRAPFVGPLRALTIPAGAFATPAGAFATPVGAFATVVDVQNRTIQVRRGRSCTADHPNVECPGRGVAGFGGLDGTAVIGGLTHTAGSGALTFPAPAFSVALAPVGSGSTTTATGVRLSGAGWTTGTVSVYNPTAGTTQFLAGTRDRSGLTLVSPVQLDIDGIGAVPSFATLRIRLLEEPGPPGRRPMTIGFLGLLLAGVAIWMRRRR